MLKCYFSLILHGYKVWIGKERFSQNTISLFLWNAIQAKGTFKSTHYHIAFITMQMDELNEMWNNKRINDHLNNIFKIILEIIPNNPNSAIQVLMKTKYM